MQIKKVSPTREGLLACLAEGFTINVLAGEVTEKTRAVMRMKSPSAAPSLTLSIGDFALLDKRLPACLAMLFNDNNAPHVSVNSLTSRSVQDMLDYWSGSIMTLPEYAFVRDPFDQHRVDKDQPIARLIAMSIGGNDIEPALAYATFDLETTSSGVVFPSGVMSVIEILDASWLARHIPAWRQRFTVASGLDLPADEVARHVFSDYVERQKNPVQSHAETALHGLTVLDNDLPYDVSS